MLENVAWNTSALMIKGDQHNVTRNTVFDGADTSPTSAIHDRPKYQDHLSLLDNLSIPSAMIGVGRPYTPLGDALSVFTQNVRSQSAPVLFTKHNGVTCPKHRFGLSWECANRSLTARPLRGTTIQRMPRYLVIHFDSLIQSGQFIMAP